MGSKRYYKVFLLGKTNVGKSSLFNALRRKREAIITPEQNYTRDLKEGIVSVKLANEEGEECSYFYYLQDVAGIDFDILAIKKIEDIIQVAQQKLMDVMKKAHLLLFVVDMQNITAIDKTIANMVRAQGIPYLMCANKSDSNKEEMLVADVAALGLGAPILVSAKYDRGLRFLQRAIVKTLQQIRLPSYTLLSTLKGEEKSLPYNATVSIVGRPNVGKSSLMNAILKRQRSLVSEISGTTRDAISDIFVYGGIRIRLIDTAGIRRKNAKKDSGEVFSLQKSLDAINQSDASLLVVSVAEGLTTHDKKIISYVVSRNKSFAIVVNKWDLMHLEHATPQKYEEGIRETFPQVAHGSNLPVVLTCCAEGSKQKSGVAALLKTIQKLIKSRNIQIKTPLLNQVIEKALRKNPPSSVESFNRKRNRLKIYYAVQVDSHPITIRFYVNHTSYLTANYQRYLENYLLNFLKTPGTFLRLQFVPKEKRQPTNSPVSTIKN